MSAETLPIIAAILILGVGAQLLARRFEVPSVLFLIVIGLLMGGEGLGIVTLDTFGAGLSTVVGLSVAIIVFDGAFHLKTSRLREASRATIRLTTIGAVITFVGIALSVRLFLDVSWSLSFLVGALLVATGPTVITPILEVVRVREHVASALEAEGIINDVTAAIAAVVIFEVFVNGEGGAVTGLLTFLERFGVGVIAGVLVAAVVYFVISRDLAPGDAPQAARFLFLSAAVGSFAVADAVAAEAGIAAAATSGILLGNADLDHEETMKEFGRDLTLLVLAFVFISLAALIDLGEIRELGIGGLAVVATVALIIRPVVIAIATVGIERFTRSEQLFLGAVGPRGIVPASVATLFSIELATEDPAAAQVLAGAVFLVIFVTVILEAGLARQIADYLGVSPMRTLIIGGGRVGRALAKRLEQRGAYVVIVENDEDQIEKTRNADFTVHSGDGTEPDVLKEAGIESAIRVIATTEEDNENLLVCQLARSKFDVEYVFSRVNDPENLDAFETLDVTAIDAPTATATAIDNEIERPAITHWMNEIGEGHDVQEIDVTAEELIGQTIAEVNAKIPDGCIVAVIDREGDTHVPSADEELRHGDRITFVGDMAAVRTAVKRFHPHD